MKKAGNENIQSYEMQSTKYQALMQTNYYQLLQSTEYQFWTLYASSLRRITRSSEFKLCNNKADMIKTSKIARFAWERFRKIILFTCHNPIRRQLQTTQ